ncbi:hypothetical protein N7457_000393 [Penicillium paradoxum]|uniref:uncharacterized protein n=1 Tax=Penicillium paradoxum TaxID=176176 RepID=UPI002547154D|nr:uncharacterized protein N7457_000393 [Penicillium paradoxum]KAJ5793794.1 hypothetical protein N7457_000393 [Penicillium paradoxum]
MWLFRGAQSAVFYYASCTPCAENTDRRKRKKDAVRVQRKKEKERCDTEIITDQPRPFPQPTPFSTNVGWREEIALGPGPPPRRGGHRNAQRTDSWKTDQSSQLKKDKSAGLMHPIGEKWKEMRYQREDEPLWGQQEVRGSSIGFSGRGRADPNETSKYYTPRVPPVNDLHPPIVSGPTTRAATRWMLQPPPSARVMAGKADVTSPTVASPTVSSPARDGLYGLGNQYRSRNTKNMTREIEPEKIISETGDGASDETTQNHRARRPSLTRLRVDAEGLDPASHSRSDSMFSTTNSDSPSLSWKCPDTPTSRPQSKATNDSGKFYRANISKTLSTMHRDNKDIHLLHLEINDDNRDEIGLGQLQPIRPWRWSMDI